MNRCQTFRRDGRRMEMAWLMAVLIMIGITTQAVPGIACPKCQVQNPDFDPDNPYETDKPCIECCENEPCDAGKGCGCCNGGHCDAPTPNCPDPLDIDFDFFRAGDCKCEPCVLGCVIPIPVPPPFDGNTCFEACSWKPAPSGITIGYLEGLCPERCDSPFNSPDDATEANYCDVLAKLDERIAKEQQAISNPPDTSDCDNPPPESFCFSNCMADHEAVHVEQLRCMWEDMKSEIIDALGDISIPFDCDSAKTPKDAAAAMNEQVNNVFEEKMADFMADWRDPNAEREQEKQAHQDTLECLQDLRNGLQERAANNGWKCD